MFRTATVKCDNNPLQSMLYSSISSVDVQLFTETMTFDYADIGLELHNFGFHV